MHLGSVQIEKKRTHARSRSTAHPVSGTHLSLGSFLVNGFLCEAVKKTGRDLQLAGRRPVDERTPVDGRTGEDASLFRTEAVSSSKTASLCPPRVSGRHHSALARWRDARRSGGPLLVRGPCVELQASSFKIKDILNSCIFLCLKRALFSHIVDPVHSGAKASGRRGDGVYKYSVTFSKTCILI